jgi:hypothetical protein
MAPKQVNEKKHAAQWFADERTATQRCFISDQMSGTKTFYRNIPPFHRLHLS